MIRPSYVYRILEVLSIYDGDTMTVRVDLGMHVSAVAKLRLFGINAPEMTTPEGRPARDRLRELCAGRALVVRTFRDPGDKYGRWLAEVWAGEECLNDRMVADGHARPYGGGSRAATTPGGAVIGTRPDGTYGFSCDRCGAIAMGDGVPLAFATVDELTIVAQRDAWLDEGEDPRRDFVVCPPCRAVTGRP